MKRLEDIDFKQTYGDVPESFSRRIQYALRRTEEEQPVKKVTVRTFSIALALCLLAATAVAAVASRTMDFFGSFYGEEKRQQLEAGDLAPGGQRHQVGDIVYTLGDVVAASETVTAMREDGTEYSYDTIALYGTGTITPAQEGKTVLMAMDEYSVNDPWGYDRIYGMDEAAPEDAVTYAQKAQETGAAIRMVSVIPNGLVGPDGNFLKNSIGYTLIPQRDGTVQFSFEIIPESTMDKQATYTLNLWLGSDEVALDGSIVEGSRQAEDWVVEIQPKVEGTPATKTDAAQQTAADVVYADWYETVAPLCQAKTDVTVTDPATGIAWKMQIAVSEDSGNFAEGEPVGDADAQAMVKAVGSTWEPHAVWVSFPNGMTYLGTLGSWGYAPEQNTVEEDGIVVENPQYACIHFPRSTEGMTTKSYALAHQTAISAAWAGMQNH